MIVILMTVFTSSKSVYAVSHGYEYYEDNICDVYVRYLPAVPYDPNRPTASEDFGVTFHVKQVGWWQLGIPIHVQPYAFWLFVFARDDCCSTNYVNVERFYPLSTSQYGLTLQWTFTGGYIVTLSTTLSGTNIASYTENRTKQTLEDGWVLLGNLKTIYNWGLDIIGNEVSTEGGVNIAVTNDFAAPHEGHHIVFELYFLMLWTDGTERHVMFIIGDDIPAETDCWLTVEQAQSTFKIINPNSGGGGGCPTLFVWNGTGYIEEGILGIHAESDITVQHRIQNTLALENGVYKLQLKELDEFTSHIDQVKLYAVNNNGEMYSCPLTYAYHSELGYVTWKLLLDDEKRVDLAPAQIIDLKFLPSIPYSQTAYFVFEINGYNVKVP